MAVGYNNLRVGEGCAIGTIVAFAGGAGQIPKGWLACNGRILNSTGAGAYEDLYDVIGNQYDYGNTQSGVFRLPNLNGAIIDINTNMSNNLPSGSIPASYTQYVNNANDGPNEFLGGTSSNFDLKIQIDPNPVNTRFSGSFKNLELNEPFYSDIVTTIGRVLGDHHLASHNHSGTYPTISETSTNGAAKCDAFGTDPANDSPVKNCEEKTYFAIEANGNCRFFASSFTKMTGPTGSNAWGQNFRNSSGNNYATFQVGALNSPARNYIPETDDVEEADQSRRGATPSLTSEDANLSCGYWVGQALYGYGTFLNIDETNFAFGNASAHTHDPVPFDITKGSMRPPTLISTNNIQIGDVTPINDAVTDIATINFANVEQASVNLIYIIRAY